MPILPRRPVRLGLLILALPAFALADAWDPGDDLSGGATPLTITTSVQTHGPHDMVSLDCEDWFKATLTAGVNYHFDTLGGTGDNFGVLYDASATNWVALDDDSAGGGQFSLDFIPTVTGLYYLQVFNFGCGAVDATGSLRYWSGTTTGGDAWDPGDNTGAGGTVIIPTTSPQTHGPHLLNASDCQDWFRINMTAGTTYHFDTSGGTGDNYGRLYSNAAGTLLVASDDDAGGSLQFSFTYTAAATQTYYLSIEPYGGCGWTWSGSLRYWIQGGPSSTTYVTTPVGWGAPAGFWHQIADGLTPSGRPFTSAGPNTMWYGQDATGDYDNGLANSGTVYTVPAAVPPSSTLAFWHWAETELSSVYDLRRVSISTNGGATWTLLQQFTGPDTNWREPRLNLSAWAGTTAVFAFYFTTVDNISNSFQGWYVDDVRVLTLTVTGSPAGPLAAALAISPGTAPAGSNVTVVLSVTNAGATAINGLLAVLTPVSGTSLVSAVSGPSPAGPVSLAPGGVQRFTWVYSVTGTGTANFAATAAGTDAVSGLQVGIGATRTVTILRPAALSVDLSVSPPVVVRGQLVTVIATFTNTGGATVNTIDASISSGCCVTGPWVSGPVPPPFLTLGPGASASFTWTFSPTGYGTSSFSTNVTGTDTVFGSGVSASDSAPLTCKAALVSATLTVDVAVYPSPAVVGQPALVVVAVTNAGDYNATGVTPTLTATGVAFTGFGGPVPAGPLTIPPLQTAFFTWTLSPAGSGSVSVFAGAAGTNTGPGGGALFTGRMMPPFIVRYSCLRAALSAPPTARRTAVVEVRLTVTNAGMGDADGLVQTLGGPGLTIVSGPSPAGGGLAAGASVTYVWTIRPDTAGSIVLTGGVTGADATGGLPVSASASATILVTAGFDEPLVVYPNPVTGDVLRIGVRARAPARTFHAGVWNVARELAYEGVWPVTTPDAILEIRGVLAWAPGLYAVRVTADLADGTTETFPFIRVAVRR